MPRCPLLPSSVACPGLSHSNTAAAAVRRPRPFVSRTDPISWLTRSDAIPDVSKENGNIRVPLSEL
ncbi:hypothetical protein RRF57_002335 [Xylaria bambusicola]|uniref:Uncharacterized protein n=1 Tax=Xylaria bambusicola TaxID=326684 RepID=A0AAN7U6S9_9PEZI